jgi:hypothetical protein
VKHSADHATVIGDGATASVSPVAAGSGGQTGTGADDETEMVGLLRRSPAAGRGRRKADDAGGDAGGDAVDGGGAHSDSSDGLGVGIAGNHFGIDDGAGDGGNDGRDSHSAADAGSVELAPLRQ